MRLLRAVLVGVIVLAIAATFVLQRKSDVASGESGSGPRSPEIEAEFGIRIVGASVTAAGGMVEIRYQILDAGKAESLSDETSPIVESHGKRFDVPALAGHGPGHLKAVAGRTSFVLLANTFGYLHHGDDVTIRVGDLELPDVTLE